MSCEAAASIRAAPKNAGPTLTSKSHAPESVPGKHVDAYLELEALQKEGKIKSIGVSNYVVEDLEELMQACAVTPAINQIEVKS